MAENKFVPADPECCNLKVDFKTGFSCYISLLVCVWRVLDSNLEFYFLWLCSGEGAVPKVRSPGFPHGTVTNFFFFVTSARLLYFFWTSFINESHRR